jgi:SAM-dependent methyltransferase
MTTPQDNVSHKNSEFWNELCGSQLAKVLGIVDSKPESLKKFDDWYFDFYPYLFDHIPFQDMKGKDVLEIGLGYGTVAQRLAETGCNYTGLDIAAGPVHMVNHRIEQNNLSGKAVQGSALEPPFAPTSFDYIVAIGCLHHTGNLALAVDQCHKLLKPGGQLIFMVYSAYSYRRWRMSTSATLSYLGRELMGHRGVVGESREKDRAAYDTGASGGGAPHTDWISKKSLNALCKKYASFNGTYENIDQEPPFLLTPRVELLKTRWPRLAGLDLYATATK